MVTAYDVVFARLADEAGIDIVLVGDSLGMVVQGERNTLAVTLDDMVYHTRIVSRGVRRAHLVADMPFMSYQASVEDGLRAAGRLLKEGRAEAVKLEGGVEVAELVRRLVAAGIPVMGHVGLTPQSVHEFGGFKLQGRTARAAARASSTTPRGRRRGRVRDRRRDACRRRWPREITRAVPARHDRHRRRPRLRRPGAGDARPARAWSRPGSRASCGATPRWARRSGEAFAAYAADVRAGKFPGPGESYD